MYSRLPPGYITKSTAIIVGSGLLGYGMIEMLWGSETFYKNAIIPVVHRYVDSENSHYLALKAARWGLLPRFGWNRKEYAELECELFGKALRNPIGLAAGFDKNGEAIHTLAKYSGFGFVEIGTVTPLPQEGNPKPRVFRLIEDEGIINRCGFNGEGAEKISKRVQAARTFWNEKFAPLGVNIGINKSTDNPLTDYEIGINHFAPHCDYIVINVSSPNTPGLRSLQKKAELEDLLSHVKFVLEESKVESLPKVLLKISPDLTEAEKRDIAQVVMDSRYGVHGLIVSNTTVSRPESLKSEHKIQLGGMSGAPLRHISTTCVHEMYKFTKGQVPIVGCGGISNGKDAYEKIRAGASLIQLYSAIAFQGFPVIGKIKRELVELLRKDGFSNINEAVGADHAVKP